MPDGDSCGCAAGTVLSERGRLWLEAGGGSSDVAGDEDMVLCEACVGVFTWSVPGAGTCEWCADGHYHDEVDGRCNDCPDWAVCRAYTTIATLVLRPGYWRLTNRTLDARECAESVAEATAKAKLAGEDQELELFDHNVDQFGPCVGGNFSHAGEDGLRRGAYCRPGHEGPLCLSCVKESTYFDDGTQQCEDCSKRSVGLVLFTTIVGVALLLVLAAVCYRKCNPNATGPRQRAVRKTASRLYMRATMLVRDTHLLVRLKIMVGFYQVVGVLRTTYRVKLPAEYDDYLGWLAWMGDLSTGLILPNGCVGDAQQRLVLAGLVPVLLLGLIALLAVGRRLAIHARLRIWAMERPPLLEELRAGFMDALPVLLPLSYVFVTNIATQAFAVFDCVSFEADAATGKRRLYMSTDYSVACDDDDASYAPLKRLAIVLVVAVTSLPVLYFILLYFSRRAIKHHAPTVLSRACYFLWHEYEPGSWWFEPVNQVRKLFLTGFVMMLPERMPKARPLAGMVVTLSFVCVMMYLDPYKSVANSRLFALQQILLLVLFQAALLMSLCEDEELCSEIGLGSAFAISMATAVWNLVLVVVILALIAHRALQQSTAPTLRCDRPTPTPTPTPKPTPNTNTNPTPPPTPAPTPAPTLHPLSGAAAAAQQLRPLAF